MLQMARCMVRAFPYYPDVPVIALWVAAGERDAGALAFLQELAGGQEGAGQSGAEGRTLGAQCSHEL